MLSENSGLNEKLGACKGEQINETNPVIKFFPVNRVRRVQGEEQQRLMLCRENPICFWSELIDRKYNYSTELYPEADLVSEYWKQLKWPTSLSTIPYPCSCVSCHTSPVTATSILMSSLDLVGSLETDTSSPAGVKRMAVCRCGGDKTCDSKSWSIDNINMVKSDDFWEVLSPKFEGLLWITCNKSGILYIIWKALHLLF